MPKNKTHKGLLKRIRITKSGKIKIGRAGGRHLKSHKSSKRIRSYRQPNYATAADIKRVRAMLNRKVRSEEQVDAIEEKIDAGASPIDVGPTPSDTQTGEANT